MAAATSSCNTAALRSTLRLIHCLQRERGASCALAGTKVSSGDTKDGSLILSQRTTNVKLARAASNAAVKAFYRIVVTDDTSSCDVASKLFQLRKYLDEEECHKEKYQFVHNIIKRFSSALSCIIRVNVTDNIISRLEHQRDKTKNDYATPLLKLLLSFVELKESLGVERAALTGIMGIGNKDQIPCARDEDHHLSKRGLPMIVNDVVMVVENQRRILFELQRQSGIYIRESNIDIDSDQQGDSTAAIDANLLRLIGDSINQSDEMKSLQDHIRKDFDINRFHEGMTMDDFWAGITLYMDKLYSMELLILEELDNCSYDLEEIDLLALSTNTTKNMSTVTTKDATDIELKEWEISLYDVEFHQRIGRGSAGTTYIGKWMGQKVAVKVASVNEFGVEGWRNELASLKLLHHPNIVRFLGAIHNQTPLTYCLILEYCNGDLSAALEKSTPAGFVVKVALDIANGLHYLHQKKLMHRDIKPSNCLLQGDIYAGNYTAKLTDFGLAAMVQNSTSSKPQDLTAETGTYRWMAPEVIRHESYQYPADIYSYALLLWELITREVPFQPLGQIEAAGSVAMEGNRPPFPSDIPITLKAIIERCWVDCPEDRMSLPAVIEWMENVRNHLNHDSLKWLDCAHGHPVYKSRPGMKTIPQKEHKKKISLLRRALFGSRKKRNDTFDRLG